MKRLIWLVILELLGFGIAVSAQTISPLYGEGGKGKVRGQFTIENVALAPIVVSVEAKSFSLTKEGGVVARPLDSNVEVQLGETSAKIGAKQKRQFDYVVTCKSAEPCTVLFESSSYLGRTREGMLIRIVLLHFAYVCSSGAKGCRATIRKGYGIAAGQ